MPGRQETCVGGVREETTPVPSRRTTLETSPGTVGPLRRPSDVDEVEGRRKDTGLVGTTLGRLPLTTGTVAGTAKTRPSAALGSPLEAGPEGVSPPLGTDKREVDTA